MSSLPVSSDDVIAAARRLEGVAHRTPVHTSTTLDARASAKVYLKCESFQRVGAFKFRGAYNAVSQLSPERRRAGVVTHSSGNHAQGVALAARLLDVPATVVMPTSAPEVKRQATLGYGATVVPCEARERDQVAARLVENQGLTLIHPYDDERIIAGAGTAALELFTETGALDVLLVPVGGGGLIAGSALAASRASPGCRVIGVEPEAGADAGRSFREGRIHFLREPASSIADGLRTRHVGERNLAIMRALVADMVTVSEEEILRAMDFLWERLKLVVEPSGAVPLAALLAGKAGASARRVGLVVSGGNVALDDAGIARVRQATSKNVGRAS